MKKFLSLLLTVFLLLCAGSCSRVRIQQGNSSQGGGEQGVLGEGQSKEENIIDEGGGEVALLEGEYENLLREGLGDLYPCQFVSVYAEDVEDYVTFAPSSPMNDLLLSCGGDSVTSAYLTLDVRVDDTFICAHAPELIVKLAPSSLLGKSVLETAGAESLKREILSREGLKDVPAIKTGNVVVLSVELLESERGRTAAKLMLAQLMYPTLFPDLDPLEVASELLGEGIYRFF